MGTTIFALFASLFITLIVIRASAAHIHVSADHEFDGPQKFHAKAVPRIGGVGIFLGVTLAVLGRAWLGRGDASGPWLLACALPTFLAGLVEDLTKTQTPRRRLLLTALSALLASLLVDATIVKTDLPVLDWLVSYSWGAVALTVFVVTGVANAVNIIDGFNGLASMCVLMMLAAVAYVALQVGDTVVMSLALAGIGAIVGFFVWNYPAGLIFLGDGGAYFLGFWVAVLGILLIHRNASVSPLFPLMLAAYPVIETVFSIYRKKWLRGMSPGIPDGVHLHMLVYKRLVRWGIGNRSAKVRTRRNSLTSPFLWMLCLTTIVPALLWWDSTPLLGFYILAFAAVYVGLYWRIVRFRTPRWLVVRRPRRGPAEPRSEAR